LKSQIERVIEQILGSPPKNMSSLGGGCIADVYKVTLQNDQIIVAKSGDAGSGLHLESDMLRYLGEHTALPVPDVLFSDDTLLLMTWLPSAGSLNEKGETQAADQLAALHDITSDQFGFCYDTVIGGLHQPNPRHDRWLGFFAEHRLMYMGQQALKAGQLPGPILSRLEKLCGRLDTWLFEPAQPSLVHGDLWGGNVLAENGRLKGFIDPAIYFAHAEIELAFTTLFNTFSNTFFDRYREHRPIDPGFFKERRDIYNLYPLLVHVHLFGGAYVKSVERTLTRFGA